MNKKGGVFFYVIATFWILIGLWFIINIVASIMGIGLGPTYDEACQEIGMKKHVRVFNEPACIDYNNEAHFIDLECEFVSLLILKEKCTATEISVGDIRVIEE